MPISINVTQDNSKKDQAFYTLFELSQETLVLIEPVAPAISIVDCNPAMSVLLGYSRDELRGKPISAIREGPTIDLQRQMSRMRDDGSVEVENVYIRKDGSALYLDITASIIDLNGREIILGICRNFTSPSAPSGPATFISDEIEQEVHERTTMLSKINELFRRYIVQFRDVQEALRQSEERNRLLVSSVADYAIILLDPQGIVSSWNVGAEQIIGFKAEEALGKSIREFLGHSDIDNKLPLATEHIQSTRTTYQTEDELPRRDGSFYWASVAVTPLFNVQSQLLGYSLIMHDITERKRREQSLHDALAKERELNALKSRFVSTASHGFRTPLTAILAASGLVRRYGQRMTEQERVDRLTRIEAEVKGMIRMLNNALTLDRVNVLQAEFNPEPLDLDAVFPAMMAEAQVDAGTVHEISYISRGDCGQVKLDKKLLGQIVINLLSNAIKFTPANRPVRFEVVCDPQQATLIVSDEGIGIEKSDQASIFQPFYRGRNAEDSPGAGLGLTVTEQAVRLHGGTLTFTSEPGVGSVFTVTLPILPAG